MCSRLVALVLTVTVPVFWFACGSFGSNRTCSDKPVWGKNLYPSSLYYKGISILLSNCLTIMTSTALQARSICWWRCVSGRYGRWLLPQGMGGNGSDWNSIQRWGWRNGAFHFRALQNNHTFYAMFGQCIDNKKWFCVVPDFSLLLYLTLMNVCLSTLYCLVFVGVLGLCLFVCLFVLAGRKVEGNNT